MVVFRCLCKEKWEREGAVVKALGEGITRIYSEAFGSVYAHLDCSTP